MNRADFVLLLGDKNLSSWSLRPWLLMRHAGVPFEEHVLRFDEEDWRETIASLSPSRKVPVLRHGESVIWDSLAICEYVAEIFPDKKLWPDDHRARAFARSISCEMHSSFTSMRKDMSMNVMARVPWRTYSQETRADVARILSIWDECRSQFGEGGPFLFGHFTIADAMFAPVVWRFRTYDAAIPSRRARQWYETMLELAAMKEWERSAEAEVRSDASRPVEKRLPAATSATQCFAVIFSSVHASPSPTGYEETAEAMVELAKKEPGFLGAESARGADGFGITVSYWESLEAIAHWKAQTDHRRAQRQGRDEFYSRYEVRICSVERGYKFARS